jgi:hypothetical protein
VAKYLKITAKELQALVETADSCHAMGGDEGLVKEANNAVKAYKAVLKRNNLYITERKQPTIRI